MWGVCVCVKEHPFYMCSLQLQVFVDSQCKQVNLPRLLSVDQQEGAWPISTGLFGLCLLCMAFVCVCV